MDGGLLIHSYPHIPPPKKEKKTGWSLAHKDPFSYILSAHKPFRLMFVPYCPENEPPYTDIFMSEIRLANHLRRPYLIGNFARQSLSIGSVHPSFMSCSAHKTLGYGLHLLRTILIRALSYRNFFQYDFSCYKHYTICINPVRKSAYKPFLTSILI